MENKPQKYPGGSAQSSLEQLLPSAKKIKKKCEKKNSAENSRDLWWEPQGAVQEIKKCRKSLL